MAMGTSLEVNARKLFLEDTQAAFYKLLEHHFSDDEALSRPAKILYDFAVERFTDSVALKLAWGIDFSKNSQDKERCIDLSFPFLILKWNSTAKALQSKFKVSLLKQMYGFEDWPSMKAYCSDISKLAIVIYPDWQELGNFLWYSISSSSITPCMVASLSLVYDLIPTYPQAFNFEIKTMVFQQLIRHRSVDSTGRTALIAVSANMMLHLPETGDEYYTYLSQMITILQEDSVSDYEFGFIALKSVIFLAKAKPNLVEDLFPSMAEALLKVMGDTDSAEDMRKLVLRFFSTEPEDETYGKLLINLPEYIIEKLVTELLQLLASVDDSIDWDQVEVYDMDAGRTDMNFYAEDALVKLAIAPGMDTLLAYSHDVLAGFFEDYNWKKRYAAVTALSIIAPFLVPSKPLVGSMFDTLLKTTSLTLDEHPCVSSAAISAISKFSTSLCPYFQKQFHDRVIPALSNAFVSFENPRVKVQAGLALSAFCKNCSSDLFTNTVYLKEQTDNLLKLLKTGNISSKETALSMLASLAESAKDGFKPFYAEVMPCLKLTLGQNYNHKLNAQTLECISVVAQAVTVTTKKEEDKFSTDAKEVVGVLRLAHNSVGTDYQAECCLLRAWRRICINLKEKFDLYIDNAMPLLLNALKLENHRIKKLDCRNRSIVSEKIALACEAILTIPIQGRLHLWIDKVLTDISPLVTFEYDEKVRVASISVMALLLETAATAVKNGLPIPGFLDSPILTLANIIIPTLVEALKSICLKTKVNAVVALKGIFQMTESWEPSSQIIDMILEVLSGCFTVKPVDFKEEIQDEHNIWENGRICFQILCKRLYAKHIIPEIIYVRKMWKKDCTPKQRRMVLDIFSDLAKECGEQGLTRYIDIIPFMFKACRDTDPNIQQIAACAIGIFCEFGRNAFDQHLQGSSVFVHLLFCLLSTVNKQNSNYSADGLSSLEHIFQQPEDSKEHTMAKEAAVLAYGKICFFFCEEINSYQNIGLWLRQLPIIHDTEDAKVTHTLLCSMVNKPETRVTGPNDDYIVKSTTYVLYCPAFFFRPETRVTGPNDDYIKIIVPIMGRVLWGTNLALPEVRITMIKQLKVFKKQFPQKFVDICRSLPNAMLKSMQEDMPS
nr:importin-5-like [Ipomoea batatas]